MPYHQLTLEEREVISQMHYSGARASVIAQRLGRSPSTIGRELRRNSAPSGYRAVVAQEQTGRRRRERPLIRKMDDPFINETVRTGQISGRMKRDHPRMRARRVSYQTIYRWLETCENRRHFRSLLRHGRYRKRRGVDGRGHLRNRVSIEERPAKVDTRRRTTTSARKNEHAPANRKSTSESDGKPHPAVHRTLALVQNTRFRLIDRRNRNSETLATAPAKRLLNNWLA